MNPPMMDSLMTRYFSSLSLPAAVALTGAGSAILAGLTNTLSQSTEVIIMNHWSIAVHWLTDLVPIVVTFFVVLSATLLSTATAIYAPLRPYVRIGAVCCIVVGIGFDMVAWFLPGPVWVTSWIDMIGRVAILVGLELAVFLVVRAVWRKHSSVIPSQIPYTDAEEVS